MMLGVGLLMMLLVIGLPILVVIALLGGMAGVQRGQNPPAAMWQAPLPMASDPGDQPSQSAAAAARYCAHCGAGLQADWTHCPQCGVPING